MSYHSLLVSGILNQIGIRIQIAQNNGIYLAVLR
jgi:hypothetical protein